MARAMKASPPWTVYVLVLVGVGGLAWSTLVDPERNLWDVGTGLFTLWIVTRCGWASRGRSRSRSRWQRCAGDSLFFM